MSFKGVLHFSIVAPSNSPGHLEFKKLRVHAYVSSNEAKNKKTKKRIRDLHRVLRSIRLVKVKAGKGAGLACGQAQDEQEDKFHLQPA